MTEMTADRLISKLNELNLHLSPEINYRVESMFPRIEGMLVNWEIRKRFRLIKQIEPVLQKMLLENEQVQLISAGKVDTVDTAMVFTESRLLCLRTNGKGKVIPTFCSIYNSQVREIKNMNTWSARGVLKFELKDGSDLKISGITKTDQDSEDSDSLDNENLQDEKNIDPPVSQSRENLCGNCLQVVPKDHYQCAACGATFWRPWEIVLRSLIFPPWGGFVMQLYLMAAIYLAYLIIIMIFVSIPLMRGDYGLAFMVLVVIYVKAAMSTWFIARKGLILKKIPLRV